MRIGCQSLEAHGEYILMFTTQAKSTAQVKLKAIVQLGSIPTVCLGDEYENSSVQLDMIERTADVWTPNLATGITIRTY